MNREFEPLDDRIYEIVCDVARQVIDNDESLHLNHDAREELKGRVRPAVVKSIYKALWLVNLIYERWKNEA